jgi:multiple sugar transport system substrate-binding protein
MSIKWSFRVLGLLIISVMLLTACNPTVATSEPVEVSPQTVEVTRVVAGTPEVVTIVVTSTPAPVEPASAEKPIELRIGVSMTPTELATWMPLLDAIDQAHPEWILVMEQTPQSSTNEKLNANAAAGTLPDVQELVGVPDVVWSDAFLPLDDMLAEVNFDKSDFFPHSLEMYTVNGSLYGLPFVGSPEVLFYNKDKFDASGVDYPTDDWTFEDFKAAAIKLTLDANDKTPLDDGFDPKTIKQWGFNANPGVMGSWATPTYLTPWGGNACANEDCSQLSFLDPEDLDSLNWWYDLVVTNHASLGDTYSGAQTGVPGDPFVSGFTAMGYNGYWNIGVLNSMGAFKYGIVQPPLGPVGRGTGLSARAYGIATNSEYPEEAWKLVQELTGTEFLANMWAIPGHSVPARRSAAQSILTLEGEPGDLSSVLEACEYMEAFYPIGPGSFEAYLKTYGTGVKVYSGELTVEEGYTEMEAAANEVLSQAQR